MMVLLTPFLKIGGFMRTNYWVFCLFFAGILCTPLRVEAQSSQERLALELPFQVNLVGLSFGLQPEVLFRPFHKHRYVGGLHLRGALGVYGGAELLHLAPIAIGARWIFFYGWRVQPFLGLGLVWQLFLPYDTHAANRIDMTMELGMRVAITRGWHVGFNFSPEFGLVNITSLGFSGSFGLGLAARITVTKDLPW